MAGGETSQASLQAARPDVWTTVVDIGNTAIKLWTVKNEAIAGAPYCFDLRHADLENGSFTGEIGVLLETAGSVAIGCTGPQRIAEAIGNLVETGGGKAVHLQKNVRLPFETCYAPGQAGIDRLANVAGGLEIARATGSSAGMLVVIDAGSAVTIDIATSEGVHLGGYILPGANMQSHALNRRTASLPPVCFDDAAEPGVDARQSRVMNPPQPPRRTLDAIYYGILLGITGAVEKAVRQVKAVAASSDNAPVEAQSAPPMILVTGGNAELILDNLDTENAQICPALTAQGLLVLARSQKRSAS